MVVAETLFLSKRLTRVRWGVGGQEPESWRRAGGTLYVPRRLVPAAPDALQDTSSAWQGDHRRVVPTG